MYLNFVDLETTDKNPVAAEILTGYVETYHESDLFNLVDSTYVECKPQMYLDASYHIHKISRERAMSFPDSRIGMRAFYKHLMKYPSTVVCHANQKVFGVNGYFDWQVLRSYCAQQDNKPWFYKTFGNYTVRSTHTMAKERLPGLSGYSLDRLANYYHLDFNHHNCVEDVKVMVAIYRELVLKNLNLLDFMEVPHDGSRTC